MPVTRTLDDLLAPALRSISSAQRAEAIGKLESGSREGKQRKHIDLLYRHRVDPEVPITLESV